MKDLTLALMAGVDIPIPSCQIQIHQPVIKEIARIGTQEYLMGMQILCLDKETYFKDVEIPQEINNFEIFQTLISDSSFDDKKSYVLQNLLILFPKHKVFLTPQSIMLVEIKNNENTCVIDSNNFQDFQEVLREIMCVKKNGTDEKTFNPKKGKAEEIAKKLMRGRERIAAEKGQESGDLFTQYISTLTIGLGSMSLEEILNLTMFQLYDLVERYTMYINWDIDIRARMAGASGDGKLIDNWMKNIH